MKLKNLSDGKSDGLMIMYVKDGTTYPVALTGSQATMLDICIAMPFKQEKLTIMFDQPQGTADNILESKGDSND